MSSFVEIRLNGEEHKVPGGSSLSDLLESLGLAGRKVAVELNRDIVPRTSYPTTHLSAGDVVEVVQFVGGG